MRDEAGCKMQEARCRRQRRALEHQSSEIQDAGVKDETQICTDKYRYRMQEAGKTRGEKRRGNRK